MTDKPEPLVSELKPCPFCNSATVKLHSNEPAKMSWVSCADCGLEAPTETGVTAEQAIEYWNTRAAPRPSDVAGREEIARIIDPQAYEEIKGGWESLARLESQAHAQLRAESKADRILSLSAPVPDEARKAILRDEADRVHDRLYGFAAVPDEGRVHLHWLVDWVHLYATEGHSWISRITADKLIALATRKPEQADANYFQEGAPLAAFKSPPTSQPPAAQSEAVALPRFIGSCSDDDPRKVRIVFAEPLTIEQHAELAKRCVASPSPARSEVLGKLSDQIEDLLCEGNCKNVGMCNGTEATWCGRQTEKILAAVAATLTQPQGAGPITTEQLDQLQFGRQLHERPQGADTREAWQDIDTYPRDHFPRQLYGPYGQFVGFLDTCWDWWPVPATEALAYKPTHWRPLPTPPRSSTATATVPIVCDRCGTPITDDLQTHCPKCSPTDTERARHD